jgi:hypothetical protein
MRVNRRGFYRWLVAVFPVFFLLHWNGLLAGTYDWALRAVHGTDRVLLQATFAFVSAAILCAAVALVFEGVRRMLRDGGPPPRRGRRHLP